jgi:hypothetical protein
MIWKILDQIEAGFPDGTRYSNAPNAKTAAAWRVVAEHASGKQEAECRKVIATWIKSGLLIEKKYRHPTRRAEVVGLWVDFSKRPD